jgi:hypothetical protein
MLNSALFILLCQEDSNDELLSFFISFGEEKDMLERIEENKYYQKFVFIIIINI